MRSILGAIFAFIAFACCISLYGERIDHMISRPVNASVDSVSPEDSGLYEDYSDGYEEDSEYCEDDSCYDEDESGFESLNDIRFADFEYEDWYDNEYIHALRKFLDDFSNGKTKIEGMESYRNIAKGKFVLYSIEPALLGGVFIMFTFIDKPEDVFSTWVYSDVNEDTREVSNYTVHGIKLEDIKNEMPREDILKVVEERPELKLF
ncbi:MAG: hypothetical protein IKX18_04885 [Muribaculaceae bacterium]|nr:hypothetical protein [Muribaculaceae bacterium]MBR5685472.1 hypothetical protein [Muribaculaceae bacterium]